MHSAMGSILCHTVSVQEADVEQNRKPFEASRQINVRTDIVKGRKIFHIFV